MSPKALDSINASAFSNVVLLLSQFVCNPYIIIRNLPTCIPVCEMTSGLSLYRWYRHISFFSCKFLNIYKKNDYCYA